MEYSKVRNSFSNKNDELNLCRHHLAPLIAVGSDDCNTGTGAKLQLWEYAPDRYMRILIRDIG
jgi:hypothetical protein